MHIYLVHTNHTNKSGFWECIQNTMIFYWYTLLNTLRASTYYSTVYECNQLLMYKTFGYLSTVFRSDWRVTTHWFSTSSKITWWKICGFLGPFPKDVSKKQNENRYKNKIHLSNSDFAIKDQFQLKIKIISTFKCKNENTLTV